MRSKKIIDKYHALYVNDGTGEIADEHFHPLKPLYVGDVKHSLQTSDHNGWLKCDGRAVSRQSFADLFEVIGTSFGAGNGTTTFNLPDCRGRVLGTTGSGAGLTARSAGQTAGAETHTLTEAEMPTHTHGITDPGHTHSIPLRSEGFADMGPDDDVSQGSGYNTGSSTTGITINSAGSSNAHNNMQPTIFIGNVFVYGSYETITV